MLAPAVSPRLVLDKGCSADLIDGGRCDGKVVAKGLCGPHYKAARRAAAQGVAPRFRPVRTESMVLLAGTSVRVPSDVAERFTAEAERQGLPVAELVREALASWRPLTVPR